MNILYELTWHPKRPKEEKDALHDEPNTSIKHCKIIKCLCEKLYAIYNQLHYHSSYEMNGI